MWKHLLVVAGLLLTVASESALAERGSPEVQKLYQRSLKLRNNNHWDQRGPLQERLLEGFLQAKLSPQQFYNAVNVYTNRMATEYTAVVDELKKLKLSKPFLEKLEKDAANFDTQAQGLNETVRTVARLAYMAERNGSFQIDPAKETELDQQYKSRVIDKELLKTKYELDKTIAYILISKRNTL